jgi:hypothetical protein
LQQILTSQQVSFCATIRLPDSGISGWCKMYALCDAAHRCFESAFS